MLSLSRATLGGRPVLSPDEGQGSAGSPELYETIFTSSSDGIAIIDLEGRYVRQNEAHRRLLGYADAELEGRSPALHLGEAAFGRILADLAEQGSFRGTVKSRTKNGDELDIELSAFAIRDAGGQPVAYVGIQRDLTSARSAQAQLAMARLAALVNFSDDAIISTNLQGVIETWNHGAERIFGYAAEAAVGKRITLIIPPDRLKDEDMLLERIRQGYSLEHYETKRRREDGSLIDVSLTVSPVRDENGLIVAASRIVRDVTSQKRAEEELVKLNIELEERVRRRTAELETANRELESFSYSVSHDLRTPLRTIRGFTQILAGAQGNGLSPEVREQLGFVEEAASRMAEIIDNLLKLSRVTRSELRRQTVDVSKIAREIMSQLRVQSPERRVDVRIQDGLRVDADPLLLRALLENLLDNAWKFTSRKADATIELAEEERDGHRWFYVRDTGAGFEMAQASRLFRPFTRLHRESEFEGTGIGLATVQRIVQRHGGEIVAQATLGQGATFSFRLGSSSSLPPDLTYHDAPPTGQ